MTKCSESGQKIPDDNFSQEEALKELVAKIMANLIQTKYKT